MLLKARIDKRDDGTCEPRDAQLFTYEYNIYDSNFDIVFTFASDMRRIIKRDGTRNVTISGSNHRINNNIKGLANIVVGLPSKYPISKTLIEQNALKYDYYFANNHILRRPKCIAILWQRGLTGRQKREFVRCYMLVSAALLPELSGPIITLALRGFMGDFSNYYYKQ